MIVDKSHPENRRCFAKALQGEPMFIVLGRDPTMASVLEFWAGERERLLDEGLMPDSDAERDHIEQVRGYVADIRSWQQDYAAPSKQKAYEQDRARHIAAVRRVGR